MNMLYNTCKSCKAGNGRAGLLINDNCKNCHDTITTGTGVIHTYLLRTPEEIAATLNLLTQKE